MTSERGSSPPWTRRDVESGKRKGGPGKVTIEFPKHEGSLEKLALNQPDTQPRRRLDQWNTLPQSIR
jgi:hypothetical protein